MNVWAWAGEGRPFDQEPRWLGDPPNEPPGWYSIYNDDRSINPEKKSRTIDLLSEFAIRMTH